MNNKELNFDDIDNFNSNISSTGKIELKEEKRKDEDSIEVDFLNDDFSNKLFEGRKNENSNINSFSNDEKENEKIDFKSNLNERDKEEKETLGYDDYSDISEFLIDMIDMGVSQMCGAISKEKDTSQFEIRRDKKVRLRNQMNKILEKHQFKVSIEFLFIMSLGLSFRQPITEAIKIKNTKIKEEKNKILKQKEREEKRERYKQKENEENTKEEIVEVEVEEVSEKEYNSSIRDTPFKKSRRTRRV